MSDRLLHVLSHVPESLLARVPREFPSVRVQQIPERGDLDPSIAGEVLLTQAWGSRNMAEVMTRGIRWVHAYGTGVNAFPFETLGERPLTCSRGASAVPISEWVLAVILAAEKNLPEAWVNAPPRRWNVARLGGLQGKTLGLIGIGGIGQAVAQRALAFGMRVIAHRRSPRPSPLPGVEIAPLEEVLATADHLVIAMPATPETQHMIGRDALRRMKPGVHLVNVARGEILDQEALREALGEERVGLASLDVVDPEPLPDSHWIYSDPRVRLSPHISWSGPGALDRLLDPFIDNLRRYLAGQPLEGQVDVELGY